MFSEDLDSDPNHDSIMIVHDFSGCREIGADLGTQLGRYRFWWFYNVFECDQVEVHRRKFRSSLMGNQRRENEIP